MAIARKCDRCGQFYEIPKIGELCGFAWLTGYDTDGETQFGKQYDLCADCTSELSDFMEGKPEPEKIPYEKPVIGRSIEEVTKNIVPEPDKADKPKPKKAPLTDELKEMIIREINAGKEPADIAKEMEMDIRRVTEFINIMRRTHPERFRKAPEPCDVDEQPE